MKNRKWMAFMACIIASTTIGVNAKVVESSTLAQWVSSTNVSDNTKELSQPITRSYFIKGVMSVVDFEKGQEELAIRPNENITREEAAVILGKALGYEGIAKKLNAGDKPFSDVDNNQGFITIVKDLKLMNGDTQGLFMPTKVLTKGEAINVLTKLEGQLKKPIKELHSSYAIQSSGQMEAIKQMDAVSFGWSQVSYEPSSKKIMLNTSKTVNNDFNVPLNFEMPLDLASSQGVEKYIMVYLENRLIDVTKDGKKLTLAEYIFDNKEVQSKLIEEIVSLCNKISKDGESRAFDGVTIDFENFNDASLKSKFNEFLKELNQKLEQNNKGLMVAVHPNTYFKGYDYKEIGNIADRVILMAHDYAPKTLTDNDMLMGFTVTPITPIADIYNALKEITNPVTGVTDINKIMLQISFSSTQWQVQDNKIINKKPYTPTYDKIFDRLQKEDTKVYYPSEYQNPYAIYWDGPVKNVIWYEDEQSVEAKMDLAKLFGIDKISLWRLGTIPDFQSSLSKAQGLDILDKILAE